MSTTRLPFLGLGSGDAVRHLADGFPHGVFTTDLEGRIAYWNAAAERITGYRPEDVVGQGCSILSGDLGTSCTCGPGPLRCGLARSGSTTRSCTIRGKNGRKIHIVKNAVAIRSPEGLVTGAFEAFAEVVALAEPAPSPTAREGAPGPRLIGRSPAMEHVRRIIDLVARSDATVMILGESGTGKERVAEAIHLQSARAARPFVRVSCSALNENLLESELFGHVRGAFTGALRDRRGRFQEADGGTLLLDEIGDISPMVQVKLLRVIEQRELERVGDSQPMKVDVRLLCATHRDLRALAEAGRFRADLYFRLAVFPLRVPPLRERLEDLPLLADGFLAQHGPPPASGVRVSPAALARLACHRWPGNVRELQNVLEFARVQAATGTIEPEHLPPDIGAEGDLRPGGADPRALGGPRIPDREVVLAALETSRWNRHRAAQALGVSRVTLWKWMKRYQLGARA